MQKTLCTNPFKKFYQKFEYFFKVVHNIKLLYIVLYILYIVDF